MTVSFGFAASSDAPASVRIGTNVSFVTHGCASFARIASSVMPSTGARLAVRPACERT